MPTGFIADSKYGLPGTQRTEFSGDYRILARERGVWNQLQFQTYKNAFFMKNLGEGDGVLTGYQFSLSVNNLTVSTGKCSIFGKTISSAEKVFQCDTDGWYLIYVDPAGSILSQHLTNTIIVNSPFPEGRNVMLGFAVTSDGVTAIFDTPRSTLNDYRIPIGSADEVTNNQALLTVNNLSSIPNTAETIVFLSGTHVLTKDINLTVNDLTIELQNKSAVINLNGHTLTLSGNNVSGELKLINAGDNKLIISGNNPNLKIQSNNDDCLSVMGTGNHINHNGQIYFGSASIRGNPDGSIDFLSF